MRKMKNLISFYAPESRAAVEIPMPNGFGWYSIVKVAMAHLPWEADAKFWTTFADCCSGFRHGDRIGEADIVGFLNAESGEIFGFEVSETVLNTVYRLDVYRRPVTRIVGQAPGGCWVPSGCRQSVADAIARGIDMGAVPGDWDAAVGFLRCRREDAFVTYWNPLFLEDEESLWLEVARRLDALRGDPDRRTVTADFSESAFWFGEGFDLGKASELVRGIADGLITRRFAFRVAREFRELRLTPDRAWAVALGDE